MSIREFNMQFDSTHILSKMQEQTNDWMQTTAKLSSCRDLSDLVKLQSDFSRRTLNRWMTGNTAPAKPAKTGASSKKQQPPSSGSSATPDPDAAVDEMSMVTAIKDHAARSTAAAADAPGATSDDLTTLKGVGPAMAEKLHALGINSLADIAKMDAATIERVEQAIGFRGRVTRDDWQGQAKQLIG